MGNGRIRAGLAIAGLVVATSWGATEAYRWAYNKGLKQAFVTCPDHGYMSVHVNELWIDCVYEFKPHVATRQVRVPRKK